MRWSEAVKIWYFRHKCQCLYVVKYPNRMFSHFIIIISLTWRNLQLLWILQDQVNSELSKMSSFSSTRRIFSYEMIKKRWRKIVMQNFACCTLSVECTCFLFVFCGFFYKVKCILFVRMYVLYAKFDVLVIIHVILLNIPDNYDKILSIRRRSRFVQV